MSRNKVKFVLNPDTGRNVVIGGKTWYKLVKKGILDRGDYLPPNCAYKLKKEEYENDEEAMAELEAEKERMIINNEVPKGVDPIIGMGNQIYYKKPKTTVKQSAILTSDAALDVIDQIQNGDIDIPTDMNRDEARDYLQGLIFNQMLTKKQKFKNPRLEPKATFKKSQEKEGRKGREREIIQIAKPILRRHVHEIPQRENRKGGIPLFKRPNNVRQITRIPRKKKEQIYLIPEPQPVNFEDQNLEDESEYEYEYVEVDEPSENILQPEEPETEYEYYD